VNHRCFEEIPHIASQICESVDALFAHADVLVIGNVGPRRGTLSRGRGRTSR